MAAAPAMAREGQVCASLAFAARMLLHNPNDVLQKETLQAMVVEAHHTGMQHGGACRGLDVAAILKLELPGMQHVASMPRVVLGFIRGGTQACRAAVDETADDRRACVCVVLPTRVLVVATLGLKRLVYICPGKIKVVKDADTVARMILDEAGSNKDAAYAMHVLMAKHENQPDEEKCDGTTKGTADETPHVKETADESATSVQENRWDQPRHEAERRTENDTPLEKVHLEGDDASETNDVTRQSPTTPLAMHDAPSDDVPSSHEYLGDTNSESQSMELNPLPAIESRPEALVGTPDNVKEPQGDAPVSQWTPSPRKPCDTTIHALVTTTRRSTTTPGQLKYKSKLGEAVWWKLDYRAKQLREQGQLGERKTNDKWGTMSVVTKNVRAKALSQTPIQIREANQSHHEQATGQQHQYDPASIGTSPTEDAIANTVFCGSAIIGDADASPRPSPARFRDLESRTAPLPSTIESVQGNEPLLSTEFLDAAGMAGAKSPGFVLVCPQFAKLNSKGKVDDGDDVTLTSPRTCNDDKFDFSQTEDPPATPSDARRVTMDEDFDGTTTSPLQSPSLGSPIDAVVQSDYLIQRVMASPSRSPGIPSPTPSHVSGVDSIIHSFPPAQPEISKCDRDATTTGYQLHGCNASPFSNSDQPRISNSPEVSPHMPPSNPSTPKREEVVMRPATPIRSSPSIQFDATLAHPQPSPTVEPPSKARLPAFPGDTVAISSVRLPTECEFVLHASPRDGDDSLPLTRSRRQSAKLIASLSPCATTPASSPIVHAAPSPPRVLGRRSTDEVDFHTLLPPPSTLRLSNHAVAPSISKRSAMDVFLKSQQQNQHPIPNQQVSPNSCRLTDQRRNQPIPAKEMVAHATVTTISIEGGVEAATKSLHAVSPQPSSKQSNPPQAALDLSPPPTVDPNDTTSPLSSPGPPPPPPPEAVTVVSSPITAARSTRNPHLMVNLIDSPMDRSAKLMELRAKKLKQLQDRKDKTMKSHVVGQDEPANASSSASLRPLKVSSNRQLIQNAIETNLLAGTACELERVKVVQVLQDHPGDNFIVAFKGNVHDTKLAFKGLYALEKGEFVYKVYGQGPAELHASVVKQFFRYNSGKKAFVPVSTRSFTIKTDGAALLDECFKKKKPAPMLSDSVI
ncbi:Aste57867_10497 [Aphanomyces stellatus]|uniref:Aste57867_10497 protein n=1 Tax=Aphanomyces stellatus TaxID=120398 RepID=A0A485KRL9_9STRA|nr:hypothetical protein As57867_010457 [Aphanomyces stellatus]VFT87370.1 Aste57867_10497 [Aphanomyces stellatus]